jgi:hypothetical protein
MKVEITKEAFKALVPIELPAINAKRMESAHVIEWETKGVKVIQVENYIAYCTQYFVEDINA